MCDSLPCTRSIPGTKHTCLTARLALQPDTRNPNDQYNRPAQMIDPTPNFPNLIATLIILNPNPDRDRGHIANLKPDPYPDTGPGPDPNPDPYPDPDPDPTLTLTLTLILSILLWP